MSLRESIAQATELALKEIRDPRPILVTREPFEVTELAITQFPAILITSRDETRESVSMGGRGLGRRSGTISMDIRGFVRGTELDRRRNELIEAIENALDLDRYLGLQSLGVLDSQVATIEVIDRMSPLAEVRLVYDVDYNYLRGAQ
jgi:hypothetical protein